MDLLKPWERVDSSGTGPVRLGLAVEEEFGYCKFYQIDLAGIESNGHKEENIF